MKRLGSLTAIVALLGSLTASTARADDGRCVAAFEHTQQLRASGKLRAARAEALVCSARDCPPIASRDCAAWLLELDRITPSVVFAAQSGTTELLDVTVVIDRETVTRRLDGRAMAIDPGPHHVQLTSPGYVAVEQDVLVSEGEVARKISVKLVSTTQTQTAERPVPMSRPVPPSVWVVGGVATLAAAGGLVFALDGFGKKSDLDASGCKPDCNQHDVDAMRRSLLVADILAGVGVAAAAVTVFLFVTRPLRPTSLASGRGSPFVLRF